MIDRGMFVVSDGIPCYFPRLNEHYLRKRGNNCANMEFSSSEPLKITESGTSKLTPAGAIGTNWFSVVMEAQEKSTDLMTEKYQIDESGHERMLKKLQVSSSASSDVVTLGEGTGIPKPNSLNESLIRKYSIKLISSTSVRPMVLLLVTEQNHTRCYSRALIVPSEKFARCMVGNSLFIDIMVSLELLIKQLRGQKVTTREKRKLKRTLNDIATLVPVAFLMLLPISSLSLYHQCFTTHRMSSLLRTCDKHYQQILLLGVTTLNVAKNLFSSSVY